MRTAGPSSLAMFKGERRRPTLVRDVPAPGMGVSFNLLQQLFRIGTILAASVAAVLSAGCITVAQVANLTDERCSGNFESQLSSVLTDQGEKADVADSLAHHTYIILTTAQLGPRPFLVASPSGTDYSFFVQRKADRCLLRLYGRQKGFTSYTNDITYIATRELSGCACQE